MGNGVCRHLNIKVVSTGFPSSAHNQFTDNIFTTSNFSCQHKFVGFVDRLVDTWESIKILTKFISKTVIISMVWKCEVNFGN